MADTSWAERRRRMVKCKIHGLHFDPEMSTGCTLCLRDAAKAVPKRPPQLVVILLCILGMASILFYIFGVQRNAPRAPELGVAVSPTLHTERLDPEPFRRPLEALEISLFQTPIDETSDLLIVSSDVAAQADYLSSRIVEAEPVIGEEAADQIARFGQAMPTDQVTFRDIELARGQWMRIRDQRLEPASWFFQPSQTAERVEDLAVSDYSDIASGLRGLLETGAAQAQSLAASNDGAIASDATEAEWNTFAREWRQQLASLESRLPSRPGADADGQLLAAVQDLEQALSQMRTLASEPRIPSANDSRFDDAVNLALRAQQGFDQASQ